MSDEAGKAEERAAHEAKGGPAPIDEGTPIVDEGTPTVHEGTPNVRGPSLVQAQAEQARREAGEEATEDMPTLPPRVAGQRCRASLGHVPAEAPFRPGPS